MNKVVNYLGTKAYWLGAFFGFMVAKYKLGYIGFRNAPVVRWIDDY
jgi:hypothetical protein